MSYVDEQRFLFTNSKIKSMILIMLAHFGLASLPLIAKSIVFKLAFNSVDSGRTMMSYIYLTLILYLKWLPQVLLKLSQDFRKCFWDSCFSFLWLVFFSLSLKDMLNLSAYIGRSVGLVGTTVLSILLFMKK